MLNYDTMLSCGLYKKDALQAYIEQDERGAHPDSEFLDHVISIEMAMRATETSIN
jgi:hypothetical protein